MIPLKRLVNRTLERAGYVIQRKRAGAIETPVGQVQLRGIRDGGNGATYSFYGTQMPLQKRGIDPDRPLLTVDRNRRDQVHDAFRVLNELYQLVADGPHLSLPDHHVKREENFRAVAEQLARSGLPLETFRCDPDSFQAFLDRTLPVYERVNYVAAYGELVGYFPQKAFEHWISAEYLQWAPEAVVIDLASECSPAADALRLWRPADFYKHDIQLTTDLGWKTIAGFSNAIEAPDAFCDFIMAHCAIDNFEGRADTEVFVEAARILKPGGRILIAPLHMASVFENRVALGSPGVQVDPEAAIAFGAPNTLRFGRHYSVDALRRRVIDAVPALRFRVVQVSGLPVDRYPMTATTRFMLVGTRPG